MRRERLGCTLLKEGTIREQSDAGTVRWERRGSIAFIRFDRPAARNAITPAMYDQLEDIVTRAMHETGLRVLVMRGTGGTFVAGSDITQFATFGSPEDGVAYERRIDAAIDGVERLPIPTVAVVEGVAAGAGLLLAAACDLRVCTPDARFGVPIARTVGNCLSMASTARLVAHLGPARAKALLLSADYMTAAEARASGFIYDIVRPEELDARVAELSERIAQSAPITLAVSKEAVRRVIAADAGGVAARSGRDAASAGADDRGTADIADAEGDDLIRRAYGSRDFREGVDAFLTKRPPRWTGE